MEVSEGQQHKQSKTAPRSGSAIEMSYSLYMSEPVETAQSLGDGAQEVVTHLEVI